MPDYYFFFAENALEILCWLRKAFCTEVCSLPLRASVAFYCYDDGETEGGRERARESMKRENDGEV